jgi:hypothetical protein
MSKTGITSLAIFVAAAFAVPAQAQYVVRYSDGQGYGYRTAQPYPYVAQPAARGFSYVNTQAAPTVAQPVSAADPAPALRKRRKVSARRDEPRRQPKAAATRQVHAPQRAAPPAKRSDDVPYTGRVIRAEAEVTILGPNSMSIRLYRKPDGRDAGTRVEKRAPKRNASAADGEGQAR